ncbi:proline racemase family protein [Gluconacetobacter sp. Hr-1-5]|uniref:proline racemase family protein n=1 Tax=Gluconacetobacter sp. Hr-1-5 TaxID=3395370 RepID=UPI003B518A8E
MESDETLDIVDSHTCGQPTRVILNGTGLMPGLSPVDARYLLAGSRDWVRRLAVFEPRGHRSMFAAALIEPAHPEDSFGVVFMDANGYPDMCGHATIGVATTLCEIGLIKSPDSAPTERLVFDLRTPAGLLELEASMVGGRCEAITFRTPLAYYVGSITLDIGHAGPVQVDVAYGGQYYAFLPADSVGLAVVPDAIDKLVAAAKPVRDVLNTAFSIIDPVTGEVPEIGNIVWTSPAHSPEAHARNVPISHGHSFDRSPCGTATCARMAVLVAQDKLAIGETFINESILGTHYFGIATCTHETVDGGIVPQVRGSAWITGRGQLMRDQRDPLGLGYLLGGGDAVL